MPITQDEYLNLSELLRSENAGEIVAEMCLRYARGSSENCRELLSLIPGIAGEEVARLDREARLRQKAFETLEYMLPSGAKYPYGDYGVITVMYCQCNFKKGWEEASAPGSGKRFLSLREALRGHPGLKAVGYLYLEYIKGCRGRSWRNDEVWNMIGDEEAEEMVQWCIDNIDKWTDGEDNT